VAQLVEAIPDESVRETLATWGITALTDVQEKSIAAGLLTGQSQIVSAPTSSGKTLIAEIAALKAIEAGCRVLYLVSHKALADQKFIDFQKRFGQLAAQPLTSVGLSTGDRTDGDADAQLRIATYEKAIGLILAGQVRPENTLIVADEFQIICDPNRGADIETLCTLFRQRKVKQFIGLTATVQNPSDLANWLGCAVVESTVRGTPLYQEIREGNRSIKLTFGETIPTETTSMTLGNALPKLISRVLEQGLGPVLVFAETRKEASDWAAEFIQTRPRTTSGLALSSQLELFSEETDSSEKLRATAERCVAFHTADLSAQERQVLEEGFAKSEFDVCFATSTLAAGVNFPFRTIFFPKLSFQYREVGAKLSLSEYRNMSGRAGRLGLHENGHSILLPRNTVELAHAIKLIQPINEVLKSVLLQLSIRKTVLSLIASKIATNASELDEFFRNTFYWHQLLEKNSQYQSVLSSKSQFAIIWLASNDLIVEEAGTFAITALGRAAAISGVLPETAVQLAGLLRSNKDALENDFSSLLEGLIYAACSSSEFTADKPSRILPFPAQGSSGGLAFWRGRRVPVAIDQANQRLLQDSYAIALYITGLPERKIARSTGLSAGMVQRFAYDVAWVLDGLHRISIVSDLETSQAVSNQIAQLARRVRWGAPVDTLDILRTAEKHNVPGLGRQRAMELVSRGWSTFKAVIGAKPSDLLEVLKNSLRVDAFLESMSSSGESSAETLKAAHLRIASSLGMDDLVERCYSETGTEYEKAILELLQRCSTLSASMVDDGKRPNVPDLLLKSGDLEALVECKTSAKRHGLVSKEDAWAVLQKSADFATHLRRVTLGKPGFDESGKSKVALSKDLTLVENEAFIEAVLRLIVKEIDSVTFMNWLGAPGFAEIGRLPGRYSYNLL
jgi:helicase